jgi:hypothetical protein
VDVIEIHTAVEEHDGFSSLHDGQTSPHAGCLAQACGKAGKGYWAAVTDRLRRIRDPSLRA